MNVITVPGFISLAKGNVGGGDHKERFRAEKGWSLGKKDLMVIGMGLIRWRCFSEKKLFTRRGRGGKACGVKQQRGTERDEKTGDFTPGKKKEASRKGGKKRRARKGDINKKRKSDRKEKKGPVEEWRRFMRLLTKNTGQFNSAKIKKGTVRKKKGGEIIEKRKRKGKLNVKTEINRGE